LAEKDELHNEIQQHIHEKDYLLKEINRLQQEKGDLQRLFELQRNES
jgi:hypothetical protein